MTISCHAQEGARLRILVRDTGPGLSAVEMDKLFMPFERLGAAQMGIEGTGIGLALSRKLVDAMGGAIGVESVVDEGSTFWFDLPLAESPARQHGSLEAAGGTPPGALDLASQRTVLYIEDNLSNLALIEYLLGEVAEVRLLTAMQGRLGLESGPRTPARPDPAGCPPAGHHGGRGPAPPARGPPDAGHPRGGLSADALPSTIARLRAGGAADYLTKPLDVPQFLSTLQENPRERKGLSHTDEGHPSRPHKGLAPLAQGRTSPATPPSS